MSAPVQPDSLRASLRPLAAAQPLTAEQQAYQAFYQLNRLGVQTRLGCFQAAGYQIAVQAWWPEQPRATLIVQHGYYDHMGLYRHLIEWALGMGFAVLACDLPGHGLSSGARADIGEFGEYQLVLQALLAEAAALQLPAPWHLCGQSTGGAILIDYLLSGQPGPEVGQTILLAPLIRPRAWGWSQLSYRMMKHFVREIPRRFRRSRICSRISSASTSPTRWPWADLIPHPCRLAISIRQDGALQTSQPSPCRSSSMDGWFGLRATSQAPCGRTIADKGYTGP